MLPAVVVLVIFFPTLSSATSRIPLGSKLTAAKGNHWVSANGRFALGFFNLSDRPDRYGVGIQFNSPSIPASERTVVWAAGADVSVGVNSYLLLTEAGELVLFDSSEGIIAWTSNTSNTSHSAVSSGELLDDGNFVLSFDTPSDTLLPGQILTSSQTLRAAGRNSVASYYTFSIDADGRMKLSWETNVTYWKTEAPHAEPPFVAILTPVWSTFGDDHGDSSVVFRFIRLDVDGNLRMYSLTRRSSSWTSVWQALQNQCDVFATCGLHGLCFFNTSSMASCKCPFGEAPGSSSTCLAPYRKNCGHGATMVILKHTFLYGVYPPEEASTRVSMEECRRSCLKDPYCTSATSTNDGEAWCLMKRTPFITGYQDPSLSSLSFVKICLDPVAVILPGSRSRSSSPSPPSSPASGAPRPLCTSCLAAAASAAFFALFLIQLGLAVWFMRRRRRAAETSRASLKLRVGSVGLIPLSLSEIRSLSSDFKHRLGPNTYRGVLPDKKAVVIRELKDLAESSETVDERHFQRWISILGGYCCKSERRFLVYESAKNGSVDRWRTDPRLSRKLTWDRRMEICRGVARALSYLHSECREFISHGNLSWSNVLLDGDMEAKVTDYGLCALRRRGSGGAAEEDVARFGEMVLMLVTGKEPCSDVVDSAMGGRMDPQEAERALRVAFWCIQPDERLRPAMGEVAKVLDGSLPVDPPPPPPAQRQQLECPTVVPF
ncbi:unnamed protein product [Spirodela intermedia]|uniref:Receptor-like serine/threonine-protein kinase n=1 Tax=Spirodela intermedia TaxID=51605 RepID=A0A7I8IMP8_SPIIN|nr:unnamed protein product [Spirodela intermedia]CAA6659138.1 unnamed protein product [Spirodela intermedia]